MYHPIRVRYCSTSISLSYSGRGPHWFHEYTLAVAQFPPHSMPSVLSVSYEIIVSLPSVGRW